MPAGRLRGRITLERAVERASPSGSVTRHWQPVGRFWAAVEPLRGREYFHANQIRDEVDVKITLRYPPDIEITPRMRVRQGQTLYDIQSVIDVHHAHQILELMCKANAVRADR